MQANTAGAPRAKPLAYNGQTYETEQALVVALMDGFRAGEAVGAQWLRAWVGACRNPEVRGGLRTIAEREAWHARVLEQRLRELGAEPRIEFPAAGTAERLASSEVSDTEKAREIAGYLTGPADPIAELRRAVHQLKEDRESKALLLTILDDEDASAGWFRQTCSALET